MRGRWRVSVLSMVFVVASLSARASDPFIAPTHEELAMKDLPGYPGVAAVILYQEQVSIDDIHVVRHYARIKVLTEEGKKYANVELPYTSSWDEEMGFNKKLGEIVGRTIHPDGTIIPFAGKPYLKTMEARGGAKYQAKVFSLPDVEVGSIVEYRYGTFYNLNIYEAPVWIIQGDLFVKSAHYEWFPTLNELVDSKDRTMTSISWLPLLPPGAKIERAEKMSPGLSVGKTKTYTLDVKDVPPIVEEELDPPVRSYSYRVIFNFTPYKTVEDYWKEEGKEWSKGLNAFADPNNALKAETDKITAGATTQDEKLRKIYAAVMELENTRFTRVRDAREDKAQGEKVKSAADVFKLRRGSPYQLTELFIGMARAAGMKAYGMDVPDRSIELLQTGWLSFEQFDDLIAIVNVDGKEVYFDPGWRYAPYGRLAWQHTVVTGLRQTQGGTEFGKTLSGSFQDNQTTRAANFVVDEKGAASGVIEVTYTGTSALMWRHTALSGDDESLHHALQKSMEDKLPKSMEVKVGAIKNLTDYEKPLVVTYSVTGSLGTVTGKRLLMLADPLMAGSSATFPHEKRVQPVYFEYPESMQDALRVTFRKGLALEATPSAATIKYLDAEAYDVSVTSDATSFTTRRTHVRGETLVYPKDYATLRQFYSQLESKDQETVVLKLTAAETSEQQSH